MSYLPKAQTFGLVYQGGLGCNAKVFRGRVEGVDGEVAIKVARNNGESTQNDMVQEFKDSVELSSILPNAARYHSMVQVESHSSSPAFAMEIIRGMTILNRNIHLYFSYDFKDILSQKAVAQLRENLQVARDNMWFRKDLQYFLLTEDQVINEKEHERGDLILFDFGYWEKNMSDIDHNYDSVAMPTRNLESLIHPDAREITRQ